jgi:hypothetical protein
MGSDMAKLTVKMPPLPEFSWDGYSWTSEIVLPSWAGFQIRRGSYGLVSSPEKSDGRVNLVVMPPEDAPNSPPMAEQVKAFQYLMDHDTAISNSVLQGILREYPRMQDQYGYDDNQAQELMPDIASAKDLCTLIGLSNVHVLPVAKDGVAYVGLEFGCTWDDEHGLGVMTYKDRVIQVGGADTAFLEWIAADDAESGA